MSKRIMITLPDTMHAQLTAESERTGAAMAELIRRGLSDFLSHQHWAQVSEERERRPNLKPFADFTTEALAARTVTPPEDVA